MWMEETRGTRINAEDKRQALETGADDYVEKPFELAKLASVVERNAAQLAQKTR